MNIFFKCFVFLILCFFLSACQTDTEVNYQKPYLEITYHDRNDPIKIMMKDYASKQSKEINSQGMNELMPSYLNPFNNDYILTSRLSCDMLLINVNGLSKLFNPCKAANVSDNSSLNDGVYYSRRYLLITFNQGFADNRKEYNYTLGIFNHQYQLIDTIKLKQQPYFFNIDDNNLYFITTESLYSGFNILNTYSIKNKTLKTNKLNQKETKDFFIANNHQFMINENCQLLFNDVNILNISSRCSSVQPNYNYYLQNNLIHNIFIFSKDSDEPQYAFLKINLNNPQESEVRYDNYCLNNQAWYSPQGKYCLNKKGSITFNNYKHTPIELNIKPAPGINTSYGFFNW